jgi:hypothetical protein
MMPSRYVTGKPTTIKRAASQVAHVSAPLKGLNLSSKLTTGDPLTAPVLTNFVVDDDRITCRAGYRLLSAIPGGKPIVQLVPYYGQNQKLLAATNHQLWLPGIAFAVPPTPASMVKGGFTSDDWSWTAFANLSQTDYTVMVNGADGVWSWDGADTSTDPAPVAVTSLSNANPARVTVAAGDIGKFSNGMVVTIAGADSGHAAANGPHVIGSVGAPANTFTLNGVDTSAASGAQTTGVTADPPSTGVVKEAVTAPPGEPWVVPDQFNIVLAHMNRLWFADSANLAVYYLPLQQKSGAVKVLPLNAVFKRGGSIRALYTWTTEGGVNLNDQLCIFSSNGECVIYAGTDPDSDFQLSGIFRFDAPMSKHSIVNYGGELYVLISTGLVPMSTLMRAESEQLGQVDKSVISLFLGEAIKYRDRDGWATFINPSTNRVFCNVPQGSTNRYIQMVRHMPRPVWSKYEDLPARCWGWLDPYVFFGDDSGNVFQMHPDFLNDNGKPIRVDVQMAWSQFKTPGIKHFKMLRTYTISDAALKPFVDVKVDYDTTAPTNQPDVSFALAGAEWDIADWDTSDWATGAKPMALWNGVASLGRVGAPRLTALVLNATFAITGWDVLYEPGAAI